MEARVTEEAGSHVIFILSDVHLPSSSRRGEPLPEQSAVLYKKPATLPPVAQALAFTEPVGPNFVQAFKLATTGLGLISVLLVAHAASEYTLMVTAKATLRMPRTMTLKKANFIFEFDSPCLMVKRSFLGYTNEACSASNARQRAARAAKMQPSDVVQRSAPRGKDAVKTKTPTAGPRFR